MDAYELTPAERIAVQGALSDKLGAWNAKPVEVRNDLISLTRELNKTAALTMRALRRKR